MSSEPQKNIAIALSGGGVRAMVFHMGMLKYLAERGLLERVARVSTVSGGSLLMGLVMQERGLAWPTSGEFLAQVYPSLREKLCGRSLMGGMLKQLARPWNWGYALSRANLLAMALRDDWQVTARLAELPHSPEWSINGTLAENGKRFRFKRDSLGDYETGYAESTDFPLAQAMAVSASFPGGIGPLALDATRHQWYKRESWDAPHEQAKRVEPPFRSFHLYDGGVYDNLGLEALFDASDQKPRVAGDIIIASDASSPLRAKEAGSSLNPFRLKRVVDIMYDQSRSLRVRGLVNYLHGEKGRGAYFYIATSLINMNADPDAMIAGRFPTTLRKLAHAEFDAIANHGHNVATRVAAAGGL